MFEFASKLATQRIDLESVRETLLYIEGDLKFAPGFETVAAAIGAVLAELDRVEEERGVDKKHPLASASFLPAPL